MVPVCLRADNGHTPSSNGLCLVDVVSANTPLITGSPTLVQPDKKGNAFIQVVNCSPIEQELDCGDFLGFMENPQDFEMQELNPEYISSIQAL